MSDPELDREDVENAAEQADPPTTPIEVQEQIDREQLAQEVQTHAFVQGIQG